jgi:Na+-driven multidrug efflux pump
MWFVALINNLGNDAAAAHNVAIRLESLGFLPGAAFAMAATTLAGQFLGARDYDRAGRSVLMACLTACSIMLPMGAVFYFGGLPLAHFFLDESQTAIAHDTATLLEVAGLAMLPLALHMVLSGALRGAGDTRWPLVFSLTGFLLIRIPGTYLATDVLGWGVLGAWYAMLADLTVRCLLVVCRFFKGSWKHTKA